MLKWYFSLGLVEYTLYNTYLGGILGITSNIPTHPHLCQQRALQKNSIFTINL